MTNLVIPVTKTKSPKTKPANADLGFGKYFSDHIFTINYSKAKDWNNPQIVPYDFLKLDPAASVLHYGQALFEGMKAFWQENGNCVLFRPEFNWERMAQGADRLCMQYPPKEMFLEGIQKLVETDKDWIPKEKGCSLYIRPTLIGTEGFLGVRPAEEYLFFVILSPVGSYYSGGLNPLKIWVEEDYLRAAPGGLGATKAAANYAGSLKAAFNAKKRDYSQVLWLDVSHQYIEEVGTMNIFFVFENEIVTPTLDGTILGGGVRDSILTLLKSWGKPVVERKIKISEVFEAAEKKTLKEVFGTGTAALISPVGELASKNKKIIVNQNKMGPLATELYQEITGIQHGTKTDKFKWLRSISQ